MSAALDCGGSSCVVICDDCAGCGVSVYDVDTCGGYFGVSGLDFGLSGFL